MANSIICKGCGNGDLTKMVFIENNRYVHCQVCNAVTPLYSDYVVQEVTGSVRMDGMRSFDERLANGYNLLRMEEFTEAGEEFEELKGDYSSDYRTWFGYSLAKTGNLFWGDLSVQGALLDRVTRAARGNAAAQAMVTEAKDYYKKSLELSGKLNTARQEHADKYEEMMQLEKAASPSQYRKGDVEERLDTAKSDLESISKETSRLRMRVFIFLIVMVAGFAATTQASLETLPVLLSYGAFFVGIGGAIRNFYKILQFVPMRARTKKKIQELTRELSDLNSEVEHFNDANRRKIDTVNRDISQKDRAITDCDKELADHKAAFDQLFTKWISQMGITI